MTEAVDPADARRMAANRQVGVKHWMDTVHWRRLALTPRCLQASARAKRRKLKFNGGLKESLQQLQEQRASLQAEHQAVSQQIEELGVCSPHTRTHAQ